MKKNSNSPKVLLSAGWLPCFAAWLMVLSLFSSTVLATPSTPLLHYTFDDGAGTIAAADTGAAPPANGVFNGNATRTTATPNGIGYALDISSGGAGVNDYVHCGDPAKLNSSTTLSNALTLTAWINLQAVPVAKDRIMSKINTNGGFDLYFNNASATAAVFDFDVNSTSGGCFSSAINLSQHWVFVAVTYNATTNASNVMFYTGGTNTAATLLNTASLGAGLIKNSGLEFRVGSTAASTADRTPPAWIDDVRIYDSVLSAADVEAVRAQGGYPSPMSFLVQPISQTIYPYPVTTNVIFSVTPSSTPDYLQWFYNGTNAANAISGATNATLSLINPTAAAQGAYYIIASNSTGVAVGIAGLTMVVTNSGRLSNIWNLLPGDRPYVSVNSSNNLERGLAYDALPAVGTGGDLLLMSLAGTTNLVVLNATNGAEKYFMNLGGIVPNTVAVAGDGKVYAANVTAAADASSYFIYQWPDDSSSSFPSTAYGGDPGFFTPATGLRWGDNLTVRGSGTGTQILIAPGSGTNVCLFTTADGANFTPNIITVSNVPSGFAQFGTAFGPGTNTFWAKTRGQQLYLVQYDLNTLLGGPIYSTYTAPSLSRFISTDPNQKWLAGVTTLTTAQPDIATLFDISSLQADPIWVDGAPYATANRSTFLSGAGTGVTVFGGTNYLFALDSNNGIKAFAINSILPLTPFNITSIMMQPGPAVALTWQSVSGHSYQIQAKSALTDAGWSNVGTSVPATGTSTSATNGTSGAFQFYRVQGN